MSDRKISVRDFVKKGSAAMAAGRANILRLIDGLRPAPLPP